MCVCLIFDKKKKKTLTTLVFLMPDSLSGLVELCIVCEAHQLPTSSEVYYLIINVHVRTLVDSLLSLPTCQAIEVCDIKAKKWSTSTRIVLTLTLEAILYVRLHGCSPVHVPTQVVKLCLHPGKSEMCTQLLFNI